MILDTFSLKGQVGVVTGGGQGLGKAFCLAKPDEVYALYLPLGGSIIVGLPVNGSFTAAWWNPANGRDGHFQNQARVKGGRRRFTPPDDGDWALRILREEG